jgi:hypothetical protein
VLLGAPVGGHQSVEHVLESKLAELKRLKQLNAHDAFFSVAELFQSA